MNYKRFLGAASAALLIVIAILMLVPGSWAQSNYKTLYKFKNGKDGGLVAAGVIFDLVGNLYGTAEVGGAYGHGLVFELTPNPDGSWKEKVLYSFCSLTDCSDGDMPYAGLILDQAGNLYGTTMDGGGPNRQGVVFELMANLDGTWTESVLHSFSGGTDGTIPIGGLIFDKQGNLYGTTSSSGGDYGNGMVFKLTPDSDGSWTESVVYSFGNNDGEQPYGSLTFDAVGNLYGTTLYSYPNGGWGVVFKLTPNADGSWTEKLVHRFTRGRDGASPAAGLIWDQAGNLYGTATQGGGNGTGCDNNYGCGVVFQLTPNQDGSWKERVLHHFTGSKGGGVPWGSLMFDLAGNLYGTTNEGGNLSYCDGAGCGVVFKLSPNSKGGWRETVLHAFRGQQGALPRAGVIFDAAGNLYGTTPGDYRNDKTTTFGSVFEITP